MVKNIKKRECCKDSKNWRDYALMPDNSGEAFVSYGCIKCKKIYGMNYRKYLKRVRKDNPNKVILA